MREKESAITIKRPLFWGGLVAVAVAMVALRCSLWLSVLLTVALLAFCCYRRTLLCGVLAVSFLLIAVGYRHLYVTPTRYLNGQTDTIIGVMEGSPPLARCTPYGLPIPLCCATAPAWCCCAMEKSLLPCTTW